VLQAEAFSYRRAANSDDVEHRCRQRLIQIVARHFAQGG
jgi:hypothetical protein